MGRQRNCLDGLPIRTENKSYYSVYLQKKETRFFFQETISHILMSLKLRHTYLRSKDFRVQMYQSIGYRQAYPHHLCMSQSSMIQIVIQAAQ